MTWHFVGDDVDALHVEIEILVELEDIDIDEMRSLQTAGGNNRIDKWTL